MRKILALLVLIICFEKNAHSQTLQSNLVVYSPATCTTCCDGSFTITPLGCTPGTYSITASAPIVPNVTSNGFEYTNVCYGTYIFTLTSNNCPSGTISYSVGYGATTSIANIQHQDIEINIYPNPTIDLLNLIDQNNQLQNAIIEIKNYLGQTVYTSSFTSQINLSDLSAGMYFLTIQDKANKKTVKIIKE